VSSAKLNRGYFEEFFDALENILGHMSDLQRELFDVKKEFEKRDTISSSAKEEDGVVEQMSNLSFVALSRLKWTVNVC
jgi:hypothetical protein